MISPGYEILAAPKELRPINSAVEWRAGLIDYSSHPAYADFVRSATFAQKLSVAVFFLKGLTHLLAKRIVRYEMIPYEYRAAQTIGDRLRLCRVVLGNVLRLRNGSEQHEDLSAFSRNLRDQGVAVISMPDPLLEELRRVAGSDFARLELLRADGRDHREFDASRITVDRRDSPELYALVERILLESGTIAAASAYMGRQVGLVDVNPQINDPSDTFWRDVFMDRPGHALPTSAYCHRDASGGDLKAIIYCSDVGRDNGPFTYAVGSAHMRISRFDDFICEANDHNGLSSTDVQARRRFAALPPKLRQKGAFGNDLLDTSDLAGLIAAASWKIIASAGAIVLFDTKGVHRGGMVDDGERRIVTCVLG